MRHVHERLRLGVDERGPAPSDPLAQAVGKPVGGSKDQRLITVLVIAMMQRFCTFLWNNFRTSIEKMDNRWNVKDVLVESAEEEYFVAPQRAAHSKPKLLLPILGFEIHKRMTGIEGTVTQKIEASAMNVIGSRLSDYVHHRAARASQFRAVGVGGNTKLLHHFVGKLVGSAIAATGLGEEAVVVITRKLD